MKLKLKTLEDMTYDREPPDASVVFVTDLRAEAINDIKELKKLESEPPFSLGGERIAKQVGHQAIIN